MELGATFNGSCKMISEDEFDSMAGEGQKVLKDKAQHSASGKAAVN